MKNDYQLKRIDKAIDYINHNPENDLSLKEIAKVAMFSEFHFHRLFKQTTGETPRQYIKRVRLEKACRILKYNNAIDVKELWCQLGYCTASHFSKDFRHYFGCTPSEYQKNRDEKRVFEH